MSFSEWAYYEFLLTIYSNILQGSSVAKEENSIIVAKGITYSVPNSLPLSFKKISAKKSMYRTQEENICRVEECALQDVPSVAKIGFTIVRSRHH